MITVPFIPETAPFNPDQRLWLNGYVAGLMAGKGYVFGGAENRRGPRCRCWYCSAARRVRRRNWPGKSQERQSRVAAMSGCWMPPITRRWIGAKETNLLVITSTYGDGDMPDNAQGFWDWLQTDAAKVLAHVKFSVLALGDTNYEQFCAAGKKIDARLEQLGAQRVHPLAECDVDYYEAEESKEWDQWRTYGIPAGFKAMCVPLDGDGRCGY